MATDREVLTSCDGAKITEQTAKQAVSSALKVIESDGDLRRRSLPVRVFAQNPAQVSDTPRSSSANGGYSRDTLLTLSTHTETKAAFEDSPCLKGANKTSGKELR